MTSSQKAVKKQVGRLWKVPLKDWPDSIKPGKKEEEAMKVTLVFTEGNHEVEAKEPVPGLAVHRVVLDALVNPPRFYTKKWGITHIASGFLVGGGYSSRRVAIQAAQALAPLWDWTQSPEVWRELPFEIKAKMKEILARPMQPANKEKP